MEEEPKNIFKKRKEREKIRYSTLYFIRHDIALQNVVQREPDAEKRAVLLQEVPPAGDAPLVYPQGSPDLHKQSKRMAEKIQHVLKSELDIFCSTLQRSIDTVPFYIEKFNQVHPAEEWITVKDVIQSPLLNEQGLGLGDPFWEKDSRFANLPEIARRRLKVFGFSELAYGSREYDRVLRRSDFTREQLEAARALGLNERQIYGDSINDMWRDWITFLQTYESKIFAQGHVSLVFSHANKIKIALAASRKPDAYIEDVPNLIHLSLGGKQIWNNSIFELKGIACGNVGHLSLQNHYRSDDQ